MTDIWVRVWFAKNWEPAEPNNKIYYDHERGRYRKTFMGSGAIAAAKQLENVVLVAARITNCPTTSNSSDGSYVNGNTMLVKTGQTVCLTSLDPHQVQETYNLFLQGKLVMTSA